MNRPDVAASKEVVERYQILDTPADPLFDSLASIAAHIFDAPVALISLLDENRQWFKARFGFDRTETGLDESFCIHAVGGDGVLVVENAIVDPLFADNPLVQRNGIRFYAGAPLTTADGYSLGTICVLDYAARRPEPAQLKMLQKLAELVLAMLESHRSGIDFATNRDRLKGVADNTLGGLFEFARDASGRQWLNYASAGFIDAVGVTPAEAMSDIASVFANIHPDDIVDFGASIDEAYRCEASWEHIFRVNHPTKGLIWVLGVAHPVSNSHGTITCQGCLLDVTERVNEQKSLEEAYRQLEKQHRELNEYQCLLNQIGRMAKIGAWTIDLKSEELKWSPEVYALHGVDDTFVPTLESALNFCDQAFRAQLNDALSGIAATGATMEMEYPITRPDGDRRWIRTIGEIERDDLGEPLRLIGSVQDITDEQELLARAMHNSNHDSMTGLPNRAFFFQRIQASLKQGESEETAVLLFFDLDHFKDINDAFGYEAGDAVIKEVAWRLELLLSQFKGTLFSRFGGDEFAVFLPADLDCDAMEGVIAQIGADVTRDLDIMGRRLKTAMSMGVARSEGQDETADTLFRKADLALRHAKQSGRAQIVTYTEQLADETQKDKDLLRDMLEGLEREAFEVYYQPIVDLKSGVLDSFEALLRWHHPERGLVSAGIFAHLIDDPILGQRLSDVVLEQVIETALAWTKSGHQFGQIAINITSAQLRDPFFLDRLSEISKAGLAPSSIKLEITEGVLLGRTADKASQVLERIRDMGFEIALDDFGTGYASLVHLTQFPITQLKIDMSFVRKMAHSDRDRTIVQSMCALAEGLGLTAVAEGIEDESTELMLRMMGCRLGQGYHYAKALQRQEALVFIGSQRHQRHKQRGARAGQ